MPRGDGSGPEGMGPMTGRAAGFCAGFGMPGYMNPTPGRGFGRGFGHGGGRRGGGRGWRNQYDATGMPGWMRIPREPGSDAQALSPESEKQMLARHVDLLQAQLDAMKKRLEEISTAEPKKA